MTETDAEPTCETHAWASLGVVSEENGVAEVWRCENCPAWTREPLRAAAELSWDETRLSER